MPPTANSPWKDPSKKSYLNATENAPLNSVPFLPLAPQLPFEKTAGRG